MYIVPFLIAADGPDWLYPPTSTYIAPEVPYGYTPTEACPVMFGTSPSVVIPIYCPKPVPATTRPSDKSGRLNERFSI